jgi:hypothetical protein
MAVREATYVRRFGDLEVTALGLSALMDAFSGTRRRRPPSG